MQSLGGSSQSLACPTNGVGDNGKESHAFANIIILGPQTQVFDAHHMDHKP